jgi:hypothetical protein
MKALRVISERTNKEWPSNHPLRKAVHFVLNDEKRAEFLICAEAGSERITPADDDKDLFIDCGCGKHLVYRDSAAKHLTKICFECWGKIEGP